MIEQVINAAPDIFFFSKQRDFFVCSTLGFDFWPPGGHWLGLCWLWKTVENKNNQGEIIYYYFVPI